MFRFIFNLYQYFTVPIKYNILRCFLTAHWIKIMWTSLRHPVSATCIQKCLPKYDTWKLIVTCMIHFLLTEYDKSFNDFLFKRVRHKCRITQHNGKVKCRRRNRGAGDASPPISKVEGLKWVSTTQPNNGANRHRPRGLDPEGGVQRGECPP